MYVHLLSSPEQCKDGRVRVNVNTLASKSYNIEKIPKNLAIRHHQVGCPRLSNLAMIMPRKCTLLHHNSHLPRTVSSYYMSTMALTPNRLPHKFLVEVIRGS